MFCRILGAGCAIALIVSGWFRMETEVPASNAPPVHRNHDSQTGLSVTHPIGMGDRDTPEVWRFISSMLRLGTRIVIVFQYN